MYRKNKIENVAWPRVPQMLKERSYFSYYLLSKVDNPCFCGIFNCWKCFDHQCGRAGGQKLAWQQYQQDWKALESTRQQHSDGYLTTVWQMPDDKTVISDYFLAM